jgi:hypothetical protein
LAHHVAAELSSWKTELASQNGWLAYLSTLVCNIADCYGENIKVVQELMRHGSARITVEIYSQARSPAKRAAQQRLLQMILPDERREPVIPSLTSGSPQLWDRATDLSPAELQTM